MTIAVTDNLGSEKKLQLYLDWLRAGIRDAELQVVSYRTGLPRNIAALVLTGGHDVDPDLYGGSPAVAGSGETDRKRDDFEIAALGSAMRMNIPVLGICRGMQLANVAMGGTLIPDLPGAGYTIHRPVNPGEECRHSITSVAGSIIASITGGEPGTVNSSHHQAVLKPGRGLRITAQSGDGIPEAMEHETYGEFFLLVQWHPERMSGENSGWSDGIRSEFYRTLKRQSHISP